MKNIGISPRKSYWSSFGRNTQEKISRLSLVTVHLCISQSLVPMNVVLKSKRYVVACRILSKRLPCSKKLFIHRCMDL